VKELLFYVYILASKSRRLYTGMTNNLVDRIGLHKSGAIEGFTKEYKINRLVYYETFKYVNHCINREKQIKAWRRAKKVALIEASNPTWEDLAAEWFIEEKQIPRAARDDNSTGSATPTKASPLSLKKAAGGRN
jgi:putative endonuclease